MVPLKSWVIPSKLLILNSIGYFDLEHSRQRERSSVKSDSLWDWSQERREKPAVRIVIVCSVVNCQWQSFPKSLRPSIEREDDPPRRREGATWMTGSTSLITGASTAWRRVGESGIPLRKRRAIPIIR